MIIKTTEKVELGKIYNGFQLNDSDGNPHYNQPLVILREVTKEDYLHENTNIGMILSNDRFYEISID